MDIQKIITEKNKQIYNDYAYDKETWISVSKIKETVKKEFDREGVAKKTWEKHHDNPSSEYYGMSVESIIEKWENKAARSRDNGTNVDGYIELHYLNETEDKLKEYRDAYISECADMERKFYGVDVCLKDFKSQGLKFECREIKLMLPFKHKDKTYIINGRFDAIFSKGENKLLLVDWKNSEEIKESNRWQKLLGPCDKLDECDMNLFTIQLYFYLYMLRHVYGIEMPIYCCVVQFPSKKDYYYKIFKPSFDYDEKLIEKIAKFVIENQN